MFLLSIPSPTLTSVLHDLLPRHQIAMTPPSPTQPLHPSFLGSSPYCFSYLFYKEVHWLRFISKERQLLQPGGIPHPKHSHNPPYNMVFLPRPSIEDPKTPGRGSQPHPLQAWLLPSTPSCGSGHSTGPGKVSCPMGSSPLSCHTCLPLRVGRRSDPQHHRRGLSLSLLLIPLTG